jgi:hypothetical protein
MLDLLAHGIIDCGLQGVGWGVMKAVTFGRYRGFQPEDVLFEGLVGFATVSAAGYGAYRLLF